MSIKLDLSPCPFCGTKMIQHDHCFSHPRPEEGDCILRHYSFDNQKAKDWNRRLILLSDIPVADPNDFPISPLED